MGQTMKQKRVIVRTNEIAPLIEAISALHDGSLAMYELDDLLGRLSDAYYGRK